MDPKISELPNPNNQIETLLDTDKLGRDKYRRGISEVITVLFKPKPNKALDQIALGDTFQTNTVNSCGLLGVGLTSSGFTLALVDKPDDFRVLKVATYPGDPWLNPERHIAAGTTPSRAITWFTQEVAALLRFQDVPPTPKVYDFGNIRIQGIDRPFILEEEILGRTLADQKEPLDQKERARLIFQYLLLLNTLHNSGFVMPDTHIFSEVRYQENTKPPSIKMFDFGLVQRATTDYRPEGDLDRLKKDLYSDIGINNKLLRERLALVGEPIVTKEFDDKFARAEIQTAYDGLLPIAREFPEVAKEIGENWYKLENFKPAFPYDPDAVKNLIQSRRIHIAEI